MQGFDVSRQFSNNKQKKQPEAAFCDILVGMRVQQVRTYWIAVRHELCRYALVGGSGVVLDIVTLWILKEFFGIHPVLAVVFNQLVILGYNFTLNKYWSFSNTHPPKKQLIRYSLLMSWNYVFAISMMWLFHTIFGLGYLIVRLGSIIISTLWNFVLYKYWVYR